ncbi:unnamed protein product [Brassica oleracea]|uniref:Uncharacterized protein n=1 Tax=Brassica oleracea var. oleracea TaxID=109376 RepID=A0A0D3AK55_BRAOL|nr:PREDICTED: uncharacterized protein LOC106326412 [Brassica oleracea var. oleracea]
MAATGRRSNGSSVLYPHSSSHRHQRSASPCNINLRLKRFSLGNSPNPNPPSSAAASNQKRKCSCSPTTHPGSFRCGFHRRLENEKIKALASSKSGDSGLYLRKLALANSLARIGSVEEERFRKYLTESIVKPSSLLIRRRFEFRPRLSRFYVMHKDPKD